jgi:hypothetical protein
MLCYTPALALIQYQYVAVATVSSDATTAVVTAACSEQHAAASVRACCYQLEFLLSALA